MHNTNIKQSIVIQGEASTGTAIIIAIPAAGDSPGAPHGDGKADYF